jgi:hypothetical protein
MYAATVVAVASAGVAAMPPLALNVPFVDHPVKASDVIASVALCVSIIALLRPWFLDWRRNRKASFEVRHEQYDRDWAGRDGKSDRHTRYVVKNHGPARARDVRVEFRKNGQAYTLSVGGLTRTETPLLHPGEEHHIRYMGSFSELPPDEVLMTWRDRRWRRQHGTFWPTYRDV